MMKHTVKRLILKMPLDFKPINIDKQNSYLKYFSKCSQKASDYSFVNIWGWAEVHALYWAWSDELVWIKQTIPEERYWAPVGPWSEINWKRCFDKYFTEPITFLRIPEALLQIWKKHIGDCITTQEDRDHWDYLYTGPELIELKGKRFHKKKNLLNQFRKKYDFQFTQFGPDMIDMAMVMQKDWCTWRDCESYEALAAENVVISRILKRWDRLKGLMGGAIIIDHKMAAYTLAERMSNDTLLIHFEKGNAAYKGVYQAINQMFLEYTGKNVKIVNREQDLGDPGLRKAKLSYNPIDFIKKYRINLS